MSHYFVGVNFGCLVEELVTDLVQMAVGARCCFRGLDETWDTHLRDKKEREIQTQSQQATEERKM